LDDPGIDLEPHYYKLQTLTPDVTSDFPVLPDRNSTVPRIIHQIWNDFIIPSELVENVPVLLKHHPRWKYHFWTLSTGRTFIRNRFPRLLEIYDSYTEPIDKSDLLRYVILFEYGGAFLDLDVYILRPLDRVVDSSYPCVVVREPPEHAVVLYKVEFYLANGIIFTRPGHPLFRQILDSIAVFRHNQRPCGTRMFTTNYLLYNNTLDIGTYSSKKNSVYVASSQFFLDDIDPGLHKYFRRHCRNFQRLDHLKQRGCATYVRNLKQHGKNSRYSFTKHLWAHTIPKFTFDEANDIRKIAPSATIYDSDEK